MVTGRPTTSGSEYPFSLSQPADASRIRKGGSDDTITCAQGAERFTGSHADSWGRGRGGKQQGPTRIFAREGPESPSRSWLQRWAERARLGARMVERAVRRRARRRRTALGHRLLAAAGVHHVPSDGHAAPRRGACSRRGSGIASLHMCVCVCTVPTRRSHPARDCCSACCSSRCSSCAAHLSAAHPAVHPLPLPAARDLGGHAVLGCLQLQELR